MKTDAVVPLGLYVNEWLESMLLLREAESLLAASKEK